MIELLNMDCMDYMRECEDNAFDLAIVDPPYGLKEHGGKNRSKFITQKNGNKLYCSDGGYAKKNWDLKIPDLDYFMELERVTKERIIWGVNYFDCIPRGGVIVWDKVNDGSDQSGAELAHCSTSNRVDIFRYMWRGMMQGKSIEEGTKQQGNKKLNEKRIHPTQKPVKLYDWLLRNYSEPGQRILDTHLGSGSSAIAAHYFGVDFVGIEIDEDYYKAACNRFDMETRQQALI